MAVAKEFIFTKTDFDQVRSLIFNQAGINLAEHKFDMVYGRLARRLRELKLSTVKEYLQSLESAEDEMVNFINAITTNLTYFFREEHHFDYLKNTVIDELVAKHKHDQRIRVWSAGCSTGEEPYSISMTLSSLIAGRKNWDIKILATDLDTNVLDKARTGVYECEKVDKLPSSVISMGFNRGKQADLYQVKSRIRSAIHFKHLNLMKPWPMKGAFDVIFCRNVLIYFNKETQQKLIRRFYDKLTPGGYLMLGHSESIGEMGAKFESKGKTIFCKV
ncbi:protein-glutamate O-methyltransferase CheR [Pleionea sp. CnH1-48]|uniref:CheR family methyltransferase n=1 Tax=Pleionea sp. CnH1-48 TaxID=2954494 RepID=UPI002098403E|nr:protein-glutamate O-methyltransferase CheR [Pleionea sp. CnH1-48]MCO7226116.1 protein-glutamate O-methyltransferase CheR [Pleionea sp. CnH1-48]